MTGKVIAYLKVDDYKVAVIQGRQGDLVACEINEDPAGNRYLDEHSGIRGDMDKAILGFLLGRHGIEVKGLGKITVLRPKEKK